MSQTYGAVDASGDPAGAADWQEHMGRWPAVRAYKEHSWSLIGEAAPVLDVGCGPGVDLVGRGRAVIGIDQSAVMCTRANGVGAVVCRGNAEALPFDAATFGACRTDRVMQHVADPRRALAELVRVTRPGGVVVAAEPEQESLVIAVPGVSDSLCDRVKGARRDVGYRNGRLASRLSEWFSAAGLDDVDIAAFPLVLTDPDEAFGLPAWPRLWRSQGIGAWSEAQLDEWQRGIESARDGGFVYALTFFVVSGHRV